MKTVLRQAVEAVAAKTRAQAGTLWFYDRFQDGMIRPLAVCGGGGLSDIYILPGEGVAGQVIDKGRAITIDDCRADARWTKKVDVETGFVTRSMLCVPLQHDGMVFGALQLLNKAQEAAFTEEDLRLAETAAAEMAAVMAGTELLESYRKMDDVSRTLAQENDAQRVIINRLSAYIDPTVIQEILRADGKHKKSIEMEDVAVLFADIRGFTKLAHQLSPAQLLTTLSDFLALTSRCIHRNKGIIDKFMGDCTMAYWRMSDEPEALYAACRAAVEIQREAVEFNAYVLRQTGIDIGIGVGIHAGPALLCHVGGGKYMAYTVIGNTVNTACRLEEYAPAGMVYISEESARRLGERVKVSPAHHQMKKGGHDTGIAMMQLEELF